MNHEHFMRQALLKAREGLALGQTPFGACIVRDGEIVASEHNGVWLETDITAHAEIRALRSACRILGRIDLSDCAIYSTTEPCPMCFSAIHWARIGSVYFGTSIADAQEAGFNELPIANETLRDLGNSPVRIERGLLREECLKLMRDWQDQQDRRSY